MMKGKMSKKEQAVWEEWGKAQAAKRETAVSPLYLLALILVLAVVCIVYGYIMGRSGVGAQVVVVTLTAEPEHHVRFLCLTNGDRMLPNMGVTWQRENGQTVDDVTDSTGCTIIPANEAIGLLNHVHQVMITIWPGSRPVCQDIVTGIVESGNLCPPGQ